MTLEWGDGTKVFISRHVFAARRPEVLKPVPLDSADLYQDETIAEMAPEDWRKLSNAFSLGRQGGKTATMYAHLEDWLSKTNDWKNLEGDKSEVSRIDKLLQDADRYSTEQIIKSGRGRPIDEFAKEWEDAHPEDRPANHDKIQGDDNNPWIKDSDQFAP